MACQQHGTENPSLHWEQQEGWLCLPTFSPSEATGIHPLVMASPRLAAAKQHCAAGHEVPQAWILLWVIPPAGLGIFSFEHLLCGSVMLCKQI